MKKYTINRKKYYFLGIIFIVVVWSLISILFDSSSLIFPNIFKVIIETINILKSSYIYKCLFYTILRMAIGFLVAIILATIFGTISGLNEKFRLFFEPLSTVLKTIPTASLVFLFLVLAGAKNAPIYIVVLVCFPILYEAVVSGYKNIDSHIKDTIALDKGNEFEKTIRLRLPLACPYIIAGVASSLGLSFKIEIMAEILTGSTTNGLGSAISFVQKTNPTNMTGIFAYSLIAIVLSLIFSYICEKIGANN